ncbi:Retrotransposon gag protein [Arachis hypogaea]|nr:Retrotransposon gag protein [Arachis hypogaea]
MQKWKEYKKLKFWEAGRNRTHGRHVRVTSAVGKRCVRVTRDSFSDPYAWLTRTRDERHVLQLTENDGGDFWAAFDPVSSPKIQIRGWRVEQNGGTHFHSHNFRF